MRTKTWTTFLVLALAQISIQKSTPESDSYVAAVVEFSPKEPLPSGQPETSVNAASYVSFIEKAARENVDIIVFPEAGLTSINIPARDGLDAWTTYIPPPSSNYVPCVSTSIPVSETLRTISCAAREHELYVVINIDEKVTCSNESCAADKKLFYNTNIVFDREGKIIARYRKTHLYVEPGFNVTKVPEIVTFDTDFGVTFGTFTCFDIYFKKPATYLTRMKNVTDIVFPTAWFNEVPFLSALQIQNGFAYAEDVNLLVSGYNRPKFGNAGSGIYLGRRGIATATFPKKATSELLVAVVPKKNHLSRNRPVYSYAEEEPAPEEEVHYLHDEFRRKRSEPKEESRRDEEKVEEDVLVVYRDNLAAYTSVSFVTSLERTICHGELCCDFVVDVGNVDQSSHYRAVVYDGEREFLEPVIAGLKVCSVVLCANETLASCGVRDKSETTFNSISINATFADYEGLLITPSSIGENLFPLPNWTYEEHYEDKTVHVAARLGKSAKNVLSCGIYTRDYTRDRAADKSDSKLGMQWATLTALAIVSIFLLFLYRKGWRKPWQRDNPHASEGHGPYQHLRIR